VKPGKNFAPTKTRVRNISANSGFGYQIGSMIIPSDIQTLQPTMTKSTDRASSYGPQDAPLSFYLTSRTSKLKPGISFVPTKTRVKYKSATSGIGNGKSVPILRLERNVTSPTTGLDVSLIGTEKSLSATSGIKYNITSMAATIVGADLGKPSTTVMNPYLEPLGYYLSSRTSKLKDGMSYAPTKPMVKNISGKSGIGYDIRTVLASMDLSQSNRTNPYLVVESIPLGYYLASRTSKLKDGTTYAPTKPFVKNISGKSGIGYNIRSVLTATLARKESISSSSPTLVGTIAPATDTSSSSSSVSFSLIERLEYYLSSRTSLLKPGRNYAPTSPNVKSMSGTSGIASNNNEKPSNNAAKFVSSTSSLPLESSSSSNVFNTIKERASTTLQQVRDTLIRRTSTLKQPGWSLVPNIKTKKLL
jgi:hypothetical protein